MWKIHPKPRHHKKNNHFFFQKTQRTPTKQNVHHLDRPRCQPDFCELPNLQRKLWKYLVIYNTVVFFLVSQKCPTFFGSILATLLVSATTTIDICCDTFFCTKNRESSRRREFSVPDSRTKTGRDVSLLAKLSLFYLSLGSKKSVGILVGAFAQPPFEPNKSPNWKGTWASKPPLSLGGVPTVQCSRVYPTKNHHFSWP